MTGEYLVNLNELARWIDTALGKGGTSTVTAGQVSSRIIGTCMARPETLISGAPNRIPGTIIWWTADVDHDRKTIVIVNIDPAPRPGL